MNRDLINIYTQMETQMGIYSDLVHIYQLLENEFVHQKPACLKCGTCCEFGLYDHVLYASIVEIGFIAKNVDIPDFRISDNVCPFLKNNHCSIRSFRTLGCRVFYCNMNYQRISAEIYETYLRKIKDLTLKHALRWEYQPFLQQLARFRTKRLY